LNRPPEHNLFAALTFTGAAASSPGAARAAVAKLQTLVSRELRSDLDEQDAATPKDAPSPETGELGFHDNYDRAHLTITFAIAKSGFDRLGVPVDEQPQDLIPIPWAQLGDSPTVTADQGDLALQICSDDLYICEHVLRRVEEELGDAITVTWAQVGAQRYTTRQGRTSRAEGRALIGFHDGTDNLDPRHDDADAKLVFVDPAAVPSYPPLPTSTPGGYSGADAFPPDLRGAPAREPVWTAGGTYMAVRASVQNTGTWDDLPLGEQESTVGRFKHSGAFLDLADEVGRIDDPPAFAADQSNLTVPVNSHVRKVNPRRAEDADRRIFRRGYPLIAAGPTGLSRGLLFICFARTLSTQFEFITRAWMRNPNFPQPGAGADRLLTFDQALCGGYFFVPAVTNANKPWTWQLPW
jgi:deferrochelatase/peroxidase EfeB